ncbi:hypothetical protein JRO89_XS10G0030100 [Xanthoceras sorbifolium]|uniref:Uncharacterized protein n=1 Tax=Xanthoceras sorbifolium TaxID=99658 RepID=A0ABQ8HHD2_9ROSI|nr:hypothetical protein JRO89_XS10G0030100 [Xanthoceras sorbifolium]
MLKPQLNQQSHSTKALFPLEKPFLHGNGGQSFLLQVQSRPSSNKSTKVRVGFSPSNNIKAIASPFSTKKSLSVKAVITVKRTIGSILSDVTVDLDDIKDLLGRSLLLELVSAELDPNTGLEKTTIKDHANRSVFERDGTDISYKADFKVPLDFGELGAIYVGNEHNEEMFVKDVVIEGFPNGPITINCDSWVQSKNKEKRVFFTYKSYLPSNTPKGLERLRGEELVKLRGNGQGERKLGERIYDYDVSSRLRVPLGLISENSRSIGNGASNLCGEGKPC